MASMGSWGIRRVTRPCQHDVYVTEGVPGVRSAKLRKFPRVLVRVASGVNRRARHMSFRTVQRRAWSSAVVWGCSRQRASVREQRIDKCRK